MVSEEVGKKLYKAASKGEVETLLELVEEDPYLVHGFSFPCSRNLLHIAAMHGQTAVVEKLLRINPRLARSSDSRKSFPLHIAVDEGDFEITKRLLLAAPEVCWWRDNQGMNPIHVAAVKGHVETLKVLVEKLGDLVFAKDGDGETLLHLAVRSNQLEIIRYLVESKRIKKLATNSTGETALDIMRAFETQPRWRSRRRSAPREACGRKTRHHTARAEQ
ncbi:ankyrin repeat-containing protein-like protein [Salvia divinorum]|uniref:Ankyrin repeat-containing protein-like protein n=1 Tax=Salvia divinorum TaxID=28513 RepID=A0ABD1GFP5_SALDI